MPPLLARKIEGMTMWIDPYDKGVGQRLNAIGYREQGFMWILRREATGIALDVGANIGYCTISMANKCKKIYALEPDNRSYDTLQKNVFVHKDKSDIKCFNVALAGHTGTIKFTQNKKPNLSSILDGGSEEVSCMTLSDFCKQENIVPDFIKMDIEGAEVQVLNSGMDLLRSAQKMKIALELHPSRYDENNDMRKVLEELVSYGYRFKWVENAKGKMYEFVVKKLKPKKMFGNYPRVLYKNVPEKIVIPWATEMPPDGLKIIRSIMMIKE